MPVVVSAAFAITILCVFAAQRMAVSRGRAPLIWATAAAVLGPLPLVPLAFVGKRVVVRA